MYAVRTVYQSVVSLSASLLLAIQVGRTVVVSMVGSQTVSAKVQLINSLQSIICCLYIKTWAMQ